jgi:hypothetical protein
MSFFESIPQPPRPPTGRPRRPVWSRPDAVIPGCIAADLMLIRTEQAAVAVTTVNAYPNGFEFIVRVHARDPEKLPPDPFGWHRPGLRPREPPLRLGVMYADGRRTATTAGRPRPSDDPAGRLVLTRGGGGGDEHSWRTSFWVYPLPAEGPVTLVVSWPEQGIPEARGELDGAAIRAAARRAVVLWPDEPDLEPGPASQTSTIVVEASEEGPP